MFPLVLAAFALTGSPALEPPPPAPAPDVVTTPSRWYGWQILATDLAGLGLAYSSTFTDNERQEDLLIAAGSITMGTGFAVIHLAHGEGMNALEGWAMRGGGLLGGMLVASVVVAGDDCQDELFGCLGEVMTGGAIGFATGAVLDASLNGWSSPTRELRPEPSVRFSATAAAGTTTLGLAGTF